MTSPRFGLILVSRGKENIDMPRIRLPESQAENDQLKFKTSFQKEAIESLVAFANPKDGRVLLGINYQDQAVGVTLGAKTLKDWKNQIKNSIYPKIIPDIL